MTTRSRIRAAWAFANAPKDWGAMATLTFREQPSQPKVALKKFVRAVRCEVGSIQWGWIMEFQTRGVIHFHIFFEREWIERIGFFTEPRLRHGKTTEVIRGPIDCWISETWRRCAEDDHSRFVAFQSGGIVELLRSPDAAARYIAKEAGKRVQKKLPDGVEAAGRWWWLNPEFKPRPLGVREIPCTSWPWPISYKHIFSNEDFERALARPRQHEPRVELCRRVEKIP
jgi:hypothetical protein